MKITILLNFLIILSFTLFSCKKNIKIKLRTANEYNKSYDIKISNFYKTKILFSNLIDNLQVIKLEDSEKSFLHSIDRIFAYNDYIFILDRVSDRVLEFNRQGKYIRDIGKQGMGPGEYPDVADMTIDTLRKYIILLSLGKREIEFYKFNGKHIKSIKNDFQSFYFSVLDMEKRVFIYYINYFDKELSNVKITDYNGKVLSMAFDFPKDIFPMHFPFTGNLVKNYEGVLYSDATSSIIYQILPDGSYYEKYKIDFGKDSWPETQKYNFKLFFEEISKTKVKFLTSYYIENKQAIIFMYMDKNKEKKAMFIKKTKRILASKSYMDDDIIYKIISQPVGLTSEGLFISYINLQYMHDLKNILIKYKNKNYKDSALVNRVLDLKSDSNYMLLFYNIKSF